jgi:hypothetical protein
MKTTRFFFILCVLAVLTLNISADSPITSTPFSSAYLSEKIITTTAKAKGLITPEIIDFLSKQGNPVELKMAVINQLGWQNKIKDNAAVFFRALAIKNKYKNEDDFKLKANGDELLSYAYLKAMDDYQEVSAAIKFAESALEKNPKSFTYNLITGIIKAQKALDDDWCEIYKITDSVRQNSALTMDMKAEATQIIYEYLDGYKEFCK